MKKDAKLLESLKSQFIEGGKKNGYNEKCLESLFSQFEGFASYSFNAGHSYAYSIITCQMAWLSYYYPLEFFVASLTICSDDTSKVRSYIKAVKERGFDVLAPDINRSALDFIINDNNIIFGLAAIKGVGVGLSKKLITSRGKTGYKSLGHFINKNYSILNSKVLESYTKAGCFKSLGYNKETIIKSIPYILDFLSVYKNITQYTIFDVCKISLEDYIENVIIKDSDIEDNLMYEIDSLGLYITEHPMDSILLEDSICSNLNQFEKYEDGEPFNSVGCISRLTVKKTKSKTNMCTFDLTTGDSIVECIMFPATYSKYVSSDILAEGKMIFCSGKCKSDHTKKIFMINGIDDNLTPYICKVEQKEKPIVFKDLYKLTSSDFIENILGIKLNNAMKIILEKNR